MDKILTTEQTIKVSKQLEGEDKKIVLAGGCFDILHIGHLTFLQKAKEHGDLLFVLVEADETIEKIKGPGRPINIQEDRAKLLAALEIVDHVVILSPGMQNADYDILMNEIKPAVIATTQGDPNRVHKERQAAAVNATVIDVTPPIKDQSTTRLVELLKID
jgi:rfaE bifunctional protein nucleotidyltransferase chain/domain